MKKKIIIFLIFISLIFSITVYLGADENKNNNSKNENIYSNNLTEKEWLQKDFLNEYKLNEQKEEIDKIEENWDDFIQNHTDVRGNIQEAGADSSSASVSPPKSVNENNLNETYYNIQEAGADSSSASVSPPKNVNENNLQNLKIELDKISFEENKEIENISLEELKDDEKIEFKYYKDGKKKIEVKIEKETAINIKESNESESKKKIIVSSKEHVEGPLRYFYYFDTQVKKEEIRIYWENEKLEITKNPNFEIRFYENKEGFVENVSWIIPHLSEQIYTVEIGLFRIEESEEKLLLDVQTTTQSNQIVKNPIYFNININYSNPVNCTLNINESILKNFNSNRSFLINLDNGFYGWKVYCWDINKTEINNITIGNFTINEGFNLSLNKIYLIDQNNEIVDGNYSILINSFSNSSIKIFLDRPDPYSDLNFSALGKQYVLNLNKTIIPGEGKYKISVNFDEPSAKHSLLENFSVAKIYFDWDKSSIEEGEEKTIRVIVNSEIEKIEYLVLDFGNNEENNITFLNISTNYFNQVFRNKYEKEGNYEIKTILKIDGKNFVISAGNFSVINKKDTTAPKISLSYPKDNSKIYNNSIMFEYTVSDNVKIQNCTFKLYNITGSSEVEFTNVRETNNSIKNNEKNYILLTNFDEGDYEWEITCFDNSSNKDYTFNTFRVILNNFSLSSNSAVKNTSYDYMEEIEETSNKLDEFILNEKNLGVKEKEVLESMGILEEIDYYKKLIVQIDQFFKENYKYVSSEELKKEKEKEYLNELTKIKNKIPKEVKILNDYEYVKNSIEVDLEGVIGDYLKTTNTLVGNSFIKKLAKLNLEIQQNIVVSSKIKEVEIKYENSTENFILVVKKIDLKDENYKKILEIIPKEIAQDIEEIIFLSEHKVIKKDPLIEIDYDDLGEKKEIVYLVKKNLDIKKLSKTETILFEEGFKEKEVKVTGFFITNITGNNPIYLALAILLFFCLIFLIVFIFETLKKQRWKREPNVAKVYGLINQINGALNEKDIERAREGYHELKRVYPVLPENTKKYFYKKISEILIEIDKRDIFGLVKEYEEAKRHWNKEDCLRIYQEIKKVYERLPEKYRKKIYERVMGY